MSFKDLLKTREYDGDTLLWIAEDEGAWEGPVKDWDEYHKHLYFEHIRNLDVVVTAGANHGLYVRHYAKKFRHVYAFEPDYLNFFCCVNNCQYPNVTFLNAAVGQDHGMARMVRNCKDNTGMHRIELDDCSYVPVIPIDSLRLNACDFIQLDIEGYEGLALSGAVKTIEKFKPVIAAECGAGGYVLDILTHLGYKHISTSVSDSIWIPNG